MSPPIHINDLLNIEDLSNVKIRFVKGNQVQDPIELYKNDKEQLLEWQFWNYKAKKSFQKGQIAIGFVQISKTKWLLFDISEVTKDLNLFEGVGYEHQTLKEYKKYYGRVVIHYKNKAQNLVRKADSVISDCHVSHILEETYEDDNFPGYENVNISWNNLKNVIGNRTWKTALENQKGVYLITDQSNGKKYVGSAYGADMIYGRWSDYVRNGHGDNALLRQLGFEHIKNNFKYSILDIYKSTVDDNVIQKREAWWKKVLLSRKFGYNDN